MIKKLIHEIRRNPLDTALILAFASAFFMLYLLYFKTDESGDWEQFKTENNCVQQLSENPKHATWQCDNGKVFYRWRQQR